MSKIAKGLSVVAGIAAAGLSFLVPGGQAIAGTTAGKLASAVSALSAGAGAIGQMTGRPPISTPALQDETIGAEQPYPYAMGRVKLTGHKVHLEAHGRERQDVPNPWLTETYVLTGAGPVEAIDQILVNGNALTFNPGNAGQAGGYYDKYLRGTSQLGALPESQLYTFGNDQAPPTFNYWTSSRRISGMAAMQFSALLDDKETHFRSGPPDYGAVGRWVKAYDARLDSTVDGGSGSHRLGVETTYTYHNNPAMHGLTYVSGRLQNGKLVCGGGLSINSIDVQSFIDAANVQDANGWEVNGVVYENGEDGELWNNLKQILEAGGAWPTNDGGVLRCMQNAPRVVLDTVTDEDLEGPSSTPGMTPWEAGFNTLTPRFMSEANQWSMVSTDAVAVPSLVTAQGEERPQSRDWALVTSGNQVAALAAYAIYDSVELQPIVLTVGRRFIAYEVGDALQLDVPSLGLDHVAVIQRHSIDFTTGRVTLTLVSDTTEKHTYALSRTGEGPPHPALIADGELDAAADAVVNVAVRAQNIATSHPRFADGDDITVTASGSDWIINVPAHERVYPDQARYPVASVDASSVTVTDDDTLFYLAYDDETMEGGAITLIATTDRLQAVTSDQNIDRHHLGYVFTATGATGVPATPPTEVPPRVPVADAVGPITADELREQLPNITAGELREITGIDSIAEDGLANIFDLIRADATRNQNDVIRSGNPNFAQGFTGWVSRADDDMEAAWPGSVEVGELVLSDGTPVTGEATAYEGNQGSGFTRMIYDTRQSLRGGNS